MARVPSTITFKQLPSATLYSYDGNLMQILHCIGWNNAIVLCLMHSNTHVLQA